MPLSLLHRGLLPLLLALLVGVTAVPDAEARTAARVRQPDVRSGSVLVMDRGTGAILYSRNAGEAAPIASITKLMTALVVLDGKQPLDEKIEISRADRSRTAGNASRLAVGTKLTRRELLRLALMSSENRAAQALGRSYPGGEPAFVRTMNAKARALGMSQARFVDPTGLSSRNVATPLDLAKLVSAASRSPTIRDFSTTRSQTVKVGRQLLTYQNTNPLVRDPKWEIAVQKTGYISEAGQCLVLQAEIGGRPVVMVLLNSWGKYTRVADARRLRDWLGARPAMKASARPAKAAAST
jgi:serine-type D-Ala-D-Ala endopeptidase (penicillin-binding protein 7)